MFFPLKCPVTGAVSLETGFGLCCCKPMKITTGSCYILTEACTDTRGGCVIELFAIDDDGPLLLRFTRQEPLFFMRRGEGPTPAGGRRAPLELTTFAGEKVDGLYFRSLREFYTTRRSLREAGFRPLESDVRPEERFLMERFIHRSLEYRGSITPGKEMRELIDPDIRSAEYRPPFASLSLDIETGPAREVYCIGCHYQSRGGEERGTVHMTAPGAAAPPVQTDFELRYYPDEASMLRGALHEIIAFDPDLIIGWNVIGFDLARLAEAFARAGLAFSLGRDGSAPRIFQKQSGMRSAEIAGRIVLDGPQVMRGGFHRFENYTLDNVANSLLGTGKIIDDEENKFAEIIRLFNEEKPALARYNFEDCRLVSRIFQKSGVDEQYITRSLVTGLRLDKVSMSVAAFDFFYLPRLHREGYAAPDVADISAEGHAAGGHVFTSDPGLYAHVAVLDFRSLYPSIIRTFNIDPLARLTASQNPCSTPAGIDFNRSRAILPDHIGTLLDRRTAARLSSDEALSQAIKILMNSFYGVMGTPGCRFYHPDLPTAITGTGQWILKETTAYLRNQGYQVLYGDTDSVFVQLKEEEFAEADRVAGGLVDSVNGYFRRRLQDEFNAFSHLELEYEKQYDPFFLAPMRSGIEGARKRYVGRLAGTATIEFRGMESVRSDWTEMAREFQRDLFRRFFDGEEIPLWLQGYVKSVQAGEYDRQLVYRRRLTKHSREYTRSAPPHVRAARMLDPEEKGNIRSIDYLMTPEGPVPLKLKPENIDYGHYIEKQIKPIADAVLPFLGTSFNEIVEGKQLELF